MDNRNIKLFVNSEWLRFPVEEFHANGGKKIIQINTKPNQNYSEPI